MALTPRLDLRQGQSLVMTPQLQQAIKLLQLSNLELTSHIERELERNPLLEIDTGEADNRDSSPNATNDARQDEVVKNNDSESQELNLSEENMPTRDDGMLDTGFDNIYADESKADKAQAEQKIEQKNDNSWDNISGGASSSTREDQYGGTQALEELNSAKLTLKDHVTEQVNHSFSNIVQKSIALHLIDMLDESGYLVGTVQGAAERLGASEPKVLRVLEALQKFDPIGIFARSVSECLALQLSEANRLDPMMKLFVDNIQLLADHKLDELQAITGADSEDLAEMLAEVKQLNPKPGLKYGTTNVQTIIPDVFVRQNKDGSWRIELNSASLPRVLVNQNYYSDIRKSVNDKTDVTFLTECLAEANWLVRSLEQRANTILKVATEIVKQQDAFLVYGVEYLRPLNLKTIADAVEMHESTISRVTNSKYMMTERGLFDLKYFFNSSVPSADGGEGHSSESVKSRIKRLIDDESPKKILSDDKLAGILKQSGIDIARRTVAKYREALNISSSINRRKEKKHLIK
ncbi:MAG: RNA polymerase factor sigma-54 [Rhizobiales bacterium]|nr:RNA polymerase factor sigma-54 [Hyphomicrobiales bacterium]